jgi:hypothetical protein
MKILVKFPSRERSIKFARVIDGYITHANDTNNIKFLITIDDDCPNHHHYKLICESIKQKGVDIECISGKSESKIHAINRDMDKSGDWDILLLASDDMICTCTNWDFYLRTEMERNFPDSDGVLWHWDGDPMTKMNNLNTMCIMGRKYYDRFNYIYHPDYKSLWCDNEFTDVSVILNKVYKTNMILFKHEHYSNTPGLQMDDLMRKTQGYYTYDESVYSSRKSINFGL